jgi:hypothetical protein
MIRKSLWALCAAGVAALLGATGCYTVLSHPAETNVVASGGAYRSCADCHADAAWYHPYYRYGRSHDRWRDYYGYPWWYNDHWWWHPGDDQGPGVPVETGTRHLWGSGGDSKGWSFVLPPTPPAREEQRDAPDTSSDDGQGTDQQKETDERHLWTPKKKGF